MSIITLTRGGRTISASPQAADALRRQGWTVVPEVESATAPPVAVAATSKPAPKRRTRK
jgi:hypothetical protein